MAFDPQFKVPAAAQPVFDEVRAITDAFCLAHLDQEYAALSAKMAAKLARKRPSPLLRGNPRIWAGAVLYAVGRVNFLSDPGQNPHLSTARLADLLDVKVATMTSKGRLIMDTLKIRTFDLEFSRASMIDQNPMAWLVSLNGFLVDARGLPEELQAACVEKGLIPFLPREH